jgi:hypothetical protein
MRWDYLAMVVSFAIAAFLLFACSGAESSPGSTTATASQGASPRPQPEYEDPLGATLQIAGAAPLQGGIGTYCWDGFCCDLAGPVTNVDPIPMAPGASFELQFAHGDPDEVQLTWFAAPESVPQPQNGFLAWSINPTTGEQLDGFEAVPEPGVYILSVFALWEGVGDVSYGWYVEVE